MRKITSLAIVSLMWLMGSTAFAQHQHDYVNGICSDDACTQPYEQPQLDTDGFYMLCNAGNVEWLRNEVNGGNIQLNAKLMNDIDFENKENLHYPIGDTTGKKYNGIFNGQGHRIMNLYMNYPEKEWIGFFGFLRGNGQNTEIRNLIMDKSCTIIGKHRVAAVSGGCQNNASGVKIIMENIINEAHVIATTGTDAGALMGGRDGNSPVFEIRNFINTGTIECKAFVDNGTQCYAGAVSGWYGDNGANLNENIINIGQILGIPADGRAIGRLSGTIRNIVDLSDTDGTHLQGIVEGLTPEDITSGKLAYYINSNSLCGTAFYQTIGEDPYPIPFTEPYSTSKMVYLQGELNCDGSAKEGGSYTNEEVEPVRPDHEFENGDFYCINCGAIDEKHCEQVDGFYQLNSVDDVMWFAELTKQDGYQTVNAKLNCDLDFSGIEFTGIADRNHGFKGIFDGGFHTVSNMDMSFRQAEQWVGFINFLNGGATVKNLRGDETCIIVADGNAGFIGGSTLAGDIHLENLGFEGDVAVTNGGAAGVLGCNTGSQAHIYMTNCYSTGFISGSKECAALSAWLGSSGAVIKNCWSSAVVSGIQNNDKYLFRFDSATMENVFGTDGTPLQATVIDFEEVENGALCYKLNGNQSEISWFQNLDNGQKDDFPTFMPGHAQVYPAGEMRCDGAIIGEEVTYSNSNNTIIPDHKFADGFCSVCGNEDPEYPFIKVFENADHDVNTGYTTARDGGNHQFANSVAEFWNAKSFNAYQQITGLQKGVYKLRVQGLQRAEAWSNDEGAAYETGELNPEVATLHHSSQYYAEVNGKMVANLFKDIAEDRQEESVKETENFNEGTGAYVPNSMAACHKYFQKGLYWNKPLYFYVESEQDTVKVGVQNGMYLQGNWTVWDTWRLEYVGDETAGISLIRAQQEGNIQDLSTLEGRADLEEAYKEAQDGLNANSIEEVLAAADVLSRNPLLIRQSHLAFIAYDNAVKAIIKERGTRDDLFGDATDLLDKYLEDDEEASEELPNGTYQNIIDARLLTNEQLNDEILFVQQLLQNAISNSISTGSDITNLIVNPAFNQDASFKGWTETHTQLTDAGSNFSSNSGFTDIYPVAGTWNTAFNVYQDIASELPNGIYELEAPAFYRPGGNGGGDIDGNDYIPADLFINDYYTPVMNIYKGQVLYEDAINGVNCRYDASNDPEAPHNGETTSSQDFDTGSGYVPEQRQAISFAFAGGRYINKVYGVVTDGKLRLGIRNTGKPVYGSGMTMWGKFKLTYRGYDEDVIDLMMQNFNARLESIENGHDFNDYTISMSHLEKIRTLMEEVEAASGAENKLAAIKALNDEFNTLNDSYDIFQQLSSLASYCESKSSEYSEKATNTEDPDEADKYWALSDNFFNESENIFNHMYDGDLTDEEALAYRENVLNNPALGGGFYVQGDLLDAEGNKLSYSTINDYYPMTKQADGTYTCTFKAQNRSNEASGNARAGIYVTRMDERYECNLSSRRFITPARNTHKMVVSNNTAYNDFQTVGGEYKMTYNPADSTVVFDLIGEYPWSDNAYVVGSIINQKGEQHRWKNDEMAPLAHQGNGVYEGVVKFYRDELENMYPNFTIFANRSNTGTLPYSTSTRAGWNEARYGTKPNKTILEDGVELGELVRGSDLKWYMEWGTEDPTVEVQEYKITFDMNHETITTKRMAADKKKGDLDGDGIVDGVDIVTIVNLVNNGTYSADADLDGDGTVDGVDITKLVNIVIGNVSDVKAYLHLMQELWKVNF